MRKKEFQIDDLRVIYIHSTKQATEEAIIVGEDCIMFKNKLQPCNILTNKRIIQHSLITEKRNLPRPHQ